MAEPLLPTDIQAVIEQTQKIEDELFKKPDTPPAPADAPPKPEDVPPKVDEPPAPPPEEPPPPPETPPEPPPVEDFEHKFKVLQGKYNKEIKEGKDKIKETSDRLLYLESERSDLLKKVMDLTERVGKLDDGKGDKVTETPPLVDVDNLPEVQYLKTEFPDVLKAVKTVVSHATKDTKKKLDDIEKKIEGSTKVSETTAWNTFNQYLDTNVEGWRDVNVDPEFKEWLKIPETYSGITKLELINRDIANRDGTAVAKYFKDFASSKAVKPDVPPADKPPAPSAPPAPNAPPKSKPGSPPPKRPATPDTITTEHVTDFYQKLQRGYYIGREAEAAAEEKRIEKAVMEGRVE